MRHIVDWKPSRASERTARQRWPIWHEAPGFAPRAVRGVISHLIHPTGWPEEARWVAADLITWHEEGTP